MYAPTIQTKMSGYNVLWGYLVIVAQLRAVPKLADMELSQILEFRGQEPTISFQWVSARKM